MVAQYADACNLIVADPDQAAHKLEVLRSHCDDLGRDYGAIEKTMQARAQVFQDADAFLRLAERYAALGIEHIHFGGLGPDVPATIRRFGEEVAPRIRDL